MMRPYFKLLRLGCLWLRSQDRVQHRVTPPTAPSNRTVSTALQLCSLPCDACGPSVSCERHLGISAQQVYPRGNGCQASELPLPVITWFMHTDVYPGDGDGNIVHDAADCRTKECHDTFRTYARHLPLAAEVEMTTTCCVCAAAESSPPTVC